MPEHASTSSDPGRSGERPPTGEYPEAPWKVYPKWRGPEIPEGKPRELQNDTGVGRYLPIAVILVLVIGFLLYQGAVSFALVWLPFGLLLLWQMVGGVADQTRGPAVFIMDDMPARLGDRLEGTVRIENWGQTPNRPNIRLFISRYQRIVRSRQGKEILHSLKWRTESGEHGQHRKADDRMEIPVSFELPTDHPPSSLKSTEDLSKLGEYTVWALEAESPALEDALFFELPVLEPNGTEERESASDDSTDEIVHDRHQGALSVAESSDASADESSSPSPSSADVPVRDADITVERLQGEGSRIIVDQSLKLGRIAGLTLAGLVLISLGAMIAMTGLLLTPAGLLGLLIVGGGGLCVWGAWQHRLCRTVVTVQDDEVHVQREAPDPLPPGSMHTFPSSDLIDVRVSSSRTSARTSAGSFRYEINLYYGSEDVDAGATSSIQQWAHRTDVESDRQDRLSLPKDEDMGIGMIFVAKNLSNRQDAGKLAELIRDAAM